MIDNWLSGRKINELIEKFVMKTFYRRVTANQLTLVGLVFGLCSGLFIYVSSVIASIPLLILSAVLMVISFIMDTFDGALARLEGPTIYGGILDMFCDRTVEVVIILLLVLANPDLLLWPGIFSMASIILCITIFLTLASAAKEFNLTQNGKLLYYSRGIMERSETFLFLFVMTIIEPLRVILLWIFAILVFITAIQRFRIAYIMFKKGIRESNE